MNSFSMSSPARGSMGGGVGGFNANMGMNVGGRMGGGAVAMKTEAQGVTDMVSARN